MIYTFYSYKGGVGRSMALANLAECFREKRLRVLMVDWDLEAPGLEAYFYAPGPSSGDNRLEQALRQPGLIDMLYEYRKVYPRFMEQRARVPLFGPEVKSQAADSSGGPEELARATEVLTEQLNSIAIPDFLRQ